MKVLRLIGGIDPNQGGPALSSRNSCIAAQRAGAQTTFAFPVYGESNRALADDMGWLRDEGVEVVTFPSRARFGDRRQSWGVNGPLARWLVGNRHRFDLIHCHGAWQMATALTAWMAGRGEPPMVLTPHESLTDFDLRQTRDLRTRLVKPGLRRWYLRRVGLLVLASEIEARDSVPAEIGPSGRVAVIPHPVWDDRKSPASLPEKVKSTGHMRLGFLGRLHRKKSVDVLLHALAGMDERVSLAIAGTGPEGDRLRRLAHELGLSDRIEWRGFVLGAEKDAFLREIDLLVMPSRYECFGLAAAEALAVGTPVIVTGDTGMAEIVRRHGGGIVIAQAADALQRTVAELVAAPERIAALSDEAPCAVREALSFSAHGAALMREYERLLAHG